MSLSVPATTPLDGHGNAVDPRISGLRGLLAEVRSAPKVSARHMAEAATLLGVPSGPLNLSCATDEAVEALFEDAFPDDTRHRWSLLAGSRGSIHWARPVRQTLGSGTVLPGWVGHHPDRSAARLCCVLATAIGLANWSEAARMASVDQLALLGD